MSLCLFKFSLYNVSCSCVEDLAPPFVRFNLSYFMFIGCYYKWVPFSNFIFYFFLLLEYRNINYSFISSLPNLKSFITFCLPKALASISNKMLSESGNQWASLLGPESRG